MAVCQVDSGRFTSKDIVIQYLPCGAIANHIQDLFFHADVAAGTFKLRVNGYETAAITFSDTEATLVTSINAALDATALLAPGDLVASTPGSDQIRLTGTAGAGLGWLTIEISNDSLTGNSTADPSVYTVINVQGSKLYTLSAQISKFSYEVTIDTVDVTAISEYEATEIDVKEMMTFDLSLFKANEDWNWAVAAGNRGIIYVYETGKVATYRYFAFWALFDKVSVSYPDHAVVEADMSGKRQGAMVVPFDSIYA